MPSELSSENIKTTTFTNKSGPQLNMPKVSVVMAHFRKAKAADDALASIFKTAYQDFEVIFVDNASNDGAFELFQKKYPS